MISPTLPPYQGIGPGYRPRAIINIILAYSFLFGMGLSAPVRLIPSLEFSPNLADLMLLIGIPIAFYSGSGSHAWRERHLALASVLIIWLSVAISMATSPGGLLPGDWMFYFRWIAAAFVGPSFIILAREFPNALTLFLKGIFAGSALHLMTLALANVGFEDELLSVGLSSPRAIDSWAGGQERIVTLANHPNPTMVLVSLAVPAALALAQLTRRKLWVPLSLITMGGGFYYTLSRSSIVAAVAALLIAVANRARSERSLSPLVGPAVLSFSVAFLITLTAAVGMDYDNSRFAHRADASALSENLEGRWETYIGGMAEAMDAPFGTTWTAFQDRLRSGGVLRATHNGYIFSARTIGVIVALFLVAGHFALLWRGALAGVSPVGPFAAYLVVIMFAEDVTQGPSITFLVAWLAAIGLLPFVQRPTGSKPSVAQRRYRVLPLPEDQASPISVETPPSLRHDSAARLKARIQRDSQSHVPQQDTSVQDSI